MANTYTLINAVTVGSGGASTIDFTSIPATFTDLKVVSSLRSATTSVLEIGYMRFNSDNGSNYSGKLVYGTGSATGSASTGATAIDFRYFNGNSATASAFGSTEAYITNYASANYKSVSIEGVSENNSTTAYAAMSTGLWSSTSAITSITLTVSGGQNFNQYSTAYLYGIKNS